MDEGNGTRDHLKLASSQRLLLVADDPAESRLADEWLIGDTRPALTSIASSLDGDRLEATATLALGGRILTGSSFGDASDRTHIVAAATLSALRVLLEFEASVDSATITYVGSHDVAVTVLRCESQTNPDWLVGSAVVRGDAEDATARSVLSALNRRLAR